jgi:ABC-type antimicrobial peptide transport system ATPase subunit
VARDPAAAPYTVEPATAPPACAYAPRCPYATARCAAELPLLRPVGAVQAACHHAEQVAADAAAPREA